MGDSNSEFNVSLPGQPLFLQYRPDPLVRGLPVETLTWVATDELGESSVLSSIEVHIQCNPGYFFTDGPTAHLCQACDPGYYNLPDARDQASRSVEGQAPSCPLPSPPALEAFCSLSAALGTLSLTPRLTLR